MMGQMSTCYSGGDVWNIQIPFSVAAKKINKINKDNTFVKRSSQNNVKNKLTSLLAVKEATKKGLVDCTKTANPRAASQSKVFHKEDTQICWVEWFQIKAQMIIYVVKKNKINKLEQISPSLDFLWLSTVVSAKCFFMFWNTLQGIITAEGSLLLRNTGTKLM